MKAGRTMEALAMGDNWARITTEQGFPEDGKYAAVVGGWHILIARTETGFVAFNDRCPHAASPLSSGRVRRGSIMCPLHGARFDLQNGQCIGGAYSPLKSFPVRVNDGSIEVALPDRPPAMDERPILPI
jgi:anthranilate 1,2-dioxygenase ferredoxin component